MEFFKRNTGVRNLLAISGLLAALLSSWLSSASADPAPVRTLVIGAGGVTGVYYPASGAICRLINARRHSNGLFCVVEPSDGSVDNIDQIGAGNYQLAVVQSDVAADAMLGTGRWSVGSNVDLRSVLGLYPEAVTVIARADAKIDDLTDLRGKRVGIGNAGSGARSSWAAIEKALGWKRSDIRAVDVDSADQGQALCEARIDAYVWFAGHPSASVEETLASCDAVIVNASGAAVERLLSANPEYSRITIPANTYAGQEKPVTSLGSIALLVTGANVDAGLIGTVVETLVDDVEVLRTLHPALSQTSLETFRETHAVPLHPGAATTLTAAGLTR